MLETIALPHVTFMAPVAGGSRHKRSLPKPGGTDRRTPRSGCGGRRRRRAGFCLRRSRHGRGGAGRGRLSRAHGIARPCEARLEACPCLRPPRSTEHWAAPRPAPPALTCRQRMRRASCTAGTSSNSSSGGGGAGRVGPGGRGRAGASAEEARAARASSARRARDSSRRSSTRQRSARDSTMAGPGRSGQGGPRMHRGYVSADRLRSGRASGAGPARATLPRAAEGRLHDDEEDCRSEGGGQARARAGETGCVIST